jgi:hypothetical protein
VQRTGGSEGFVRANILLSDGTATYLEDYNTRSVAVNFANGETLPSQFLMMRSPKAAKPSTSHSPIPKVGRLWERKRRRY